MPKKRRKEQRRAARLQPFVAPCRVIDGQRQIQAYLTNLSASGARISSDEPLRPGVRSLLIEVRFARRAKSCRLSARVKWTKAGTTPREAVVVGVTFERLPALGKALLDSVIKEFRRRAALVA